MAVMRWAPGTAVLLLVVAVFLARRYIGPIPIRPGVRLDAPSPLATWPWRGATRDSPHPGVTHWLDCSSPDGTALDLLGFDFAANPGLRLELYDQDEDDDIPANNEVNFWPRGVGQVARHLNAMGRGRIVAAWNGLFFESADKDDKSRKRHVAPVVLRRKVRYNVGNYRWTFGVDYRDGQPQFKALHLPDAETLGNEFTFAAAGAQCLIRKGVPLRLQAFPKPGEKPLPRPVPSTPEEAGHIPTVDHMKTSRTSMGWSRDSRHLYLLIVKEPDAETPSALALRHRVPMTGGWMLSDLQHFWQALRVWGAVNIDGGDVTQMTYLRRDGRYEMVPPRWAIARQRLISPPTFRDAPAGGTLMYFYVREAA